VHLLRTSARGKRATGDTPAMLRARGRFLRAGHYERASDAVCEIVAAEVARANDARRAAMAAAAAEFNNDDAAADDPTPSTPSTPRQRRLAANKNKSRAAKTLRRERAASRSRVASPPPPLVVDVGCGEGYWLDRVVRALGRGGGDAATASFAALDASPDAARMASKALRRATTLEGEDDDDAARAEIAVADAQDRLPFATASVAVALSVFAPRRPRELLRVIAADGACVVVSPGASHLAEARRSETLRAAGIRILDVADGKRERVTATMTDAGFVEERGVDVDGVARLSVDDCVDLVGMGPSAFHQSDGGGEERLRAALTAWFDGEGGGGGGAGGTMDVSTSFIVQVFRRGEYVEEEEDDEEGVDEVDA